MCVADVVQHDRRLCRLFLQARPARACQRARRMVRINIALGEDVEDGKAGGPAGKREVSEDEEGIES